jgi:DNA-binding Lrp family transcriptional regulator
MKHANSVLGAVTQRGRSSAAGPAGRPEGLSELDRRIVAALQSDARASWRRIAEIVNSSESTVARRARALAAVGAIRSPIRVGLGNPVLVQLRCQPRRGRAVARQLADHPDVRFVTLVTGPFDVMAELIVPSKRRLMSFLFDELASIEGITDTSTETVLRNFKTSYDWSWNLLGIAPPARVAHESHGGPLVDLDDVDQHLAARLRENGRSGFPELAEALGITESMARRRVDALVSSGALLPITLVDPGLLGFEIELTMWLHVDLSRLEDAARALVALPGVRYLSATSGYSDLVGEVILRSHEELYTFRTQVLGALPGLRRADLALELQTLKRAYLRLDDGSGVDPT